MNPDQIYYPDQPSPPIQGCLIHSSEPKVSEYSVPREGWSGVRYGLCEQCVQTLALYPSYQSFIDGVVNERVTKQEKERDNVRNV